VGCSRGPSRGGRSDPSIDVEVAGPKVLRMIVGNLDIIVDTPGGDENRPEGDILLSLSARRNVAQHTHNGLVFRADTSSASRPFQQNVQPPPRTGRSDEMHITHVQYADPVPTALMTSAPSSIEPLNARLPGRSQYAKQVKVDLSPLFSDALDSADWDRWRMSQFVKRGNLGLGSETGRARPDQREQPRAWPGSWSTESPWPTTSRRGRIWQNPRTRIRCVLPAAKGLESLGRADSDFV